MKETIREYLLREGVGYTKRAPKNIELTFTQKMLINEMIQQGANQSTINGIMSRLKTEKKQQQMLNYLKSTKDIPIPTGTIVMKSIEIKQMEE